jgi:hypothetical protein
VIQEGVKPALSILIGDGEEVSEVGDVSDNGEHFRQLESNGLLEGTTAIKLNPEN